MGVNAFVNKNILVSVIIPIYGVEKYIEKCVRSLFSQTLTDVEYIFIDDCSPDASIVILERLIFEYRLERNVSIIRHQTNRGLPSARNTGLQYAKGIYIFHCDSDDFLEHDALELLYNAAKITDADIVWSDFYLSFENNERYMSQNPKMKGNHLNSDFVLRKMLDGSLKYNVWNKLIKRSLYVNNQIFFPDGRSMGEDMTIIKLFVHAKIIVYLPKAVYHYVQLNTSALTKSMSDIKMDQVLANVYDLDLYIRKFYKSDLDNYLHYFKLNVKLPFLISEDVNSYKKWNNLFLESNKFIDTNPSFNFRAKLIQKFALSRQYWILKLYNLIVMRFVYGVVYK